MSAIKYFVFGEDSVLRNYFVKIDINDPLLPKQIMANTFAGYREVMGAGALELQGKLCIHIGYHPQLIAMLEPPSPKSSDRHPRTTVGE